ncbi:MAG: diguanylate cyclase [Ruminococcus sp.]|uniref:GGDEF domain-containing protein n=1 Tax=Ruminococcus sp. TaxID=41978 RepID=UPI0025E2169A|nr:diguanylate cyclase [Ruminococcus sp.]MBR5684435.1 diguanylate cyclase [Ruminococcus sp.]
MNKQEKRIRTSKRNFIIALALLLLTNILMAMALTTMAKKTLREQIDQRMLDIANTAAYMINGDEIKNLQKEDAGTEPYQRALETLRAFQDNINLDYIYGIRQMPDGSFTFTIDPAVEDPGEFGSPIVSTEALRSAAKGIAAVDKEAYKDEWGRFYSAYSPVFDSEHKVAGIVAVDFNAKWYDGKLNNHKAISVVILMAALTVGIVLTFIITSQNRKRFAAMIKEIDQLDAATDKINDSILKTSIKKLDFLPNSESSLLKTLADGEENKQSSIHDEYEEVTSNLHSVCKKLNKYIKFIDSNMYKDELTNTLNKAAYKNAIQALDEDIKTNNPLFSVAFFDLIGLNRINAHYGFEAGDELMFHSARILKKVFGNDNVYRVAGDEFIAIMKDKGILDMEELFAQLDKELKEFNNIKKIAHELGISKGSNTYKPAEHDNYRHVFMVARENMKKEKALYYQSLQN